MPSFTQLDIQRLADIHRRAALFLRQRRRSIWGEGRWGEGLRGEDRGRGNCDLAEKIN